MTATDARDLAAIIRKEFAPPFCPEGLVEAVVWEDSDGDCFLRLRIAKRDAEILCEPMQLISAGTSLF